MSIPFKAQQLDKQTLLVVDGMNLAFRYLQKGTRNFLDDYVRTVDSLQRSFKAGAVIIASDKGSSTYRKALYPGYKSARKKKYEKQTEEEREQMELFFQDYRSVIDSINYEVLQFQGCEADDIGAYICNAVTPKYKVWLASSDKDWDLLVSKHVSRFSYVTREEITLETWHEHYEYEPEDHISIKCLMGDSGDSIPGVNGIGPKKAHALVKEYGSTYDIIASLPIQSRYKHIQALNEFGGDNLLLNYKLMDLVSHCAEALGEENCKIIDERLKTCLAE